MDAHPGSVLGAYRISSVIGEGGMGTVYRAHDSRLGRDVAIKVVRPDLALDPDRLARFDREARLLASLNHPHIATVYGFEQAGDIRFLVMELVAGPTLADRLCEGPLPLDEALTVAGQIAAAMEAAHDRGIIHRDLKPSNITLTPSSGAKVLDFGLAKALTGDSAANEIERARTLTSGGTADGVILGTAAFMSPEQARGKPVDKRVDTWAFGCVLFDMLTGRSAFAGDTLSDTIANILTRDPDWGALPEGVPASIRRLLRRCLEKDPGRRLRDMGDARLEIDDALAGRYDAGTAAPSAAAHRSAHVTRILHPLGWAALGALAVAALAGLLNRPAPTARPAPVRFAVTLPESQRLSSLDFPIVAVSPGGTHIAYVATVGGPPQVFVRSLSELETRPLAGTQGAFGPFFSPDGQWIGFFADGRLKKVPVQGGPVRSIADAPIGFGATWGPDGIIIFAPANASGLWRVPEDGGTPKGLTELNTERGEFSHRWPDLLPDGRALLFTSGTEGSWDDAEVVVQPLDGGERRVLVRGGNSPRFVPGGYLAYARAGSIFVAPIDQTEWRLTGDAVKVVDGVAHSVDGAAQFSVSRAGTLVYVPEAARNTARSLVWVDRQGAIQPLPAPPRAYASPRLSPDGRVLALVIGGDRDEIWTYHIARNALAQLTYEGGSAPAWTADGLRIVFGASRGGPADLFWRGLEAGAEERLNRSARVEVPHSTSPDGKWLAFVEYDASTSRDISLLALGDRRVLPFLATAAHETAPAFSPDGQWIAYVSDSEGRNEVWVASAADPARRTQVSNGGGTEPVWRRDGPELFYRAGDRIMSTVIRPGPAAQAARMLFRGTFQTGLDGRPGYDVSADGARFLMITSGEDQGPPRDLHLVLEWNPAVRER
jgi:serine/threonine-protein kinase